MHSLDFRSYMNRSSGLVSLSQYIESESSGAWAQGTDSLGHLLEYETLGKLTYPYSFALSLPRCRQRSADILYGGLL